MYDTTDIELAAEAAYESMRDRFGFPTDFKDAPEPLKNDYRTLVKAAFDATEERISRRAQVEILNVAADFYWNRLPDGTGNARAYNSYTVARELRSRAQGIKEGK